MTFGGSIFLIVLGAILAFAVNVATPGLDLNMVGVILMIAGVVGLMLSLLYWRDMLPWHSREVVHERTVGAPVETTRRRERVREVVVDDPPTYREPL